MRIEPTSETMTSEAEPDAQAVLYFLICAKNENEFEIAKKHVCLVTEGFYVVPYFPPPFFFV